MSEELTEGTGAVEAKLAEAGADNIRRSSFSEAPEAAPDANSAEGTPAETVSAEQPRDEAGRFAAQQTEEPEEQETVAESQQVQDPAVQALLDKYGGDVDKALAGAVHLQRKAGQQSNELGELRRAVDELTQLREIQQADFQSRRQQTSIDQGTVDWFDEQVMQNPQGAVEWARQQGNNILFQRGMAGWKEMQPYEAGVYTTNLQLQQYQQEMEKRLNAATQLPVDASINLALSNVRARNPQFVNYDDAIEATLQKHPFAAKALESAAASNDAQQLEGAIETLYSLAVGDTLRNLALTGETPENTTASTEVVEPTTSETREPAPEPTREEQFRALFKQEADRRRNGVWVAE